MYFLSISLPLRENTYELPPREYPPVARVFRRILNVPDPEVPRDMHLSTYADISHWNL